MFKVLTSFDCPGCGSQRALHAALHGDLSAAWQFNPAIFFALPLILIYSVVELMPERRQGRLIRRVHRAVIHPVFLMCLLVAVIGWTVLRNL